MTESIEQRDFYLGVLAALDVVLLHDNSACAGEIIRNVGAIVSRATAENFSPDLIPGLERAAEICERLADEGTNPKADYGCTEAIRAELDRLK